MTVLHQGHAVGLDAGWLIAQKAVSTFDSVSDSGSLPRCLQLGTGQWCPPAGATWFPTPGPAIFYASDLGHQIGSSVEIIYLRRDR